MPIVLGSGEHRYAVMENWAKLPDGWEFKDVAAVACDSKDRVYVFNRGEHPMMVFDRDGRFLGAWGEGQYPRAHGLHIDANDILYLTDDGGHVVRKCTTEGKVLLELGVPGKPTPYMSGQPFHRCTHTALSPKGEIYVADRENHRVQVFDGNGKYEAQWSNLHRPCGLYCCRGPKLQFIIGELGPGMAVNRNHPNIGPRLSIVDAKGKLVARLGGEAGPGLASGKFVAPHGLAVDSRGDIYVGEVSYTEWPRLFPDIPIARGMRSLQKLKKIS